MNEWITISKCYTLYWNEIMKFLGIYEEANIGIYEEANNHRHDYHLGDVLLIRHHKNNNDGENPLFMFTTYNGNQYFVEYNDLKRWFSINENMKEFKVVGLETISAERLFIYVDVYVPQDEISSILIGLKL